MGEIAELLTMGVLCEACGEYTCEECGQMGIPMYCSRECARSRGADISQVCDHGNEEDEM